MTKIDMRSTILAKSDQLNADDLIGGDITIKITNVRIVGSSDQPCVINFDGDNGKPWKPCKSMRRVLIFLWGDDGSNYIGKYLTLHLDPTVKWRNAEVGGVRITHASGITEDQILPLTVTRGNKKAFTVRPLRTEQSKNLPIMPDSEYQDWTDKMDSAKTEAEIKKIGSEIGLVVAKYNPASISRLRLYYNDRLSHINGEKNITEEVIDQEESESEVYVPPMDDEELFQRSK